jgi:hypothetical protein
MLIIWGSSGKEVTMGGGVFYCPKCDTERKYAHKRVDKYFTLYFIPLFKTGSMGEYIECRLCRKQYTEAVLKRRPPTEAERIQTSVRRVLMKGAPLKVAFSRLLKSGLDPETASRVVWSVCGDAVRICEGCQAAYILKVPKCAACKTSLKNAPRVEATEARISQLLAASLAAGDI